MTDPIVTPLTAAGKRLLDHMEYIRDPEHYAALSKERP